MRTPMELAGDFYDYHLQYYRWFLHRRLVFSEFDSNELKRLTSYQIMKNDDRANIGSLLSQTTLLGASAGLGCGAMRYAVDTTARQVPKLKATRTGLSMIVLGTGIGIAYGALVNLVSNYRDKNDEVNHAIAAMVAFPATAVYAKKNKYVFGFFNGVIMAAALAFIKSANNGGFFEVRRGQRDGFVAKTGVYPDHWAPK